MASGVNPKSAVNLGTSTTNFYPSNNISEKNKQWQRELLMERLRSHSSQHKSYPDLSKAMRMGLLEKRYAMDAVEKSNLQKCLDSMQHCIKVTSRQGLVERLESLSRQLGLKFMDDTKALFISTDMFFLEIVLDANGSLTDVKVHHECKVEQQSCSELVDCLNRGDFADFTAQLEGFSSIYQLNAEPKVKTKAFDAMQAIETDLYNIFQMQNFSKDMQHVMKSSVVGIALKRRGGHSMRLVYFVSPYDLISLESNSIQSLTLDLLQNKQIGFSVTVNLEAASANKLQILPTVTFVKDTQTGSEVPVFAPLTPLNSMLLPATFVLRLNKPLPVCYNSLRSMGLGAVNTSVSLDPNIATTTVASINNSSSLETTPNKSPMVTKSIMSLVIQTASDQQLKNIQKGLFVCLPDQTHCYFFTENKLLESTVINSVPFTEPSQVPKILDFLKKHALFYSLLSSCVRPQSKMGNDIDSTTVLEVNAVSFTLISVSLQHPYEEYMITVEFELRNGNIQCTIYSLSNNYDLLSLKLTNVVQKCCSVPVTIRALLKFLDQEQMYQRGGGGSSTLASGASVGPPTGGSSDSVASFGNYGMSGMSNDPGNSNSALSRCVGGGHVGTMKMEQNGQQPQVHASGYLKFKGPEIINEDFRESPKSQTIGNMAMGMTTAVADTTTTTTAATINQEVSSSLGQQQQQQSHQHEQQQVAFATSTSTPSDTEVADKYKNIWNDKTTSMKNCVSITPILGQNDGNGTTDANKCSAEGIGGSVGIEIIPIGGQNSIPCSGNGAASGATPPTSAITNNVMSAAVSNSNTGTLPPTTITITPINANATLSSGGIKEQKSHNGSAMMTTASSVLSGISSNSSLAGSVVPSHSLNRSSDLPAKEKKRKKKRDDSPMGPPEKVYSRQNSPAGAVVEVSGGVRKFPSPSSSPKGSSASGLLLSGVTGSSLTTRPSPKHSPVYSSSPKHNTASNSPKSPFGTHSPKHGYSGKPSMSTLKNVTVSATPKGSEAATASALNAATLVRSLATAGSNSSNSTSNTVPAAAAAATIAALKAKEKCTTIPSAVVSSAAAAAAAAVKSSMGVTSTMQQLKNVSGLNHMAAAAAMAAASTYGGNISSTINSNALDINSVMRKGVSAAFSSMTSTIATSAVNSISEVAYETPALEQPLPDPSLQAMPLLGNNEINLIAPNLNSVNSDIRDNYTSINCSSGNKSNITSDANVRGEYMIRSSQMGLKLTLNKTNSTNIGASGKGKLATNHEMNKKYHHTGLKPGVSSGPASKKSPYKGTKSPGAPVSKHLLKKSKSSGNMNSTARAMASNKVAPGGLIRSNSTTAIAMENLRKSNKKCDNSLSMVGSSLPSPSPFNMSSSSLPTNHQPVADIAAVALRNNHNVDIMKILQYASPSMAVNMENFMKSFNSKFQIPKITQRIAQQQVAETVQEIGTITTTTTENTSTPTTTIFSNINGGDIPNTLSAAAPVPITSSTSRSELFASYRNNIQDHAAAPQRQHFDVADMKNPTFFSTLSNQSTNNFLSSASSSTTKNTSTMLPDEGVVAEAALAGK